MTIALASTAAEGSDHDGRLGHSFDPGFAPYLAGPASAIDLGRVSPIELVPPLVELGSLPVRNQALSRAINIAFAILGLVLASPVLVVAAVLIKLDSPGPILHSQTRVGIDRRWRSSRAGHEARREDLGGRAFTIYKLRTMREDAESESGAVWATRGDPRITGIGRVLRRYRLDELPQLWNVILGDMNIVGPRPERPPIVSRLRQDIPDYQLRHRVKPGITGLAQINQTYDASLDDVRSKVAWDLSYIQRQSLWLDIKVMLLTIPTVILKVRGW